jgi:hypothetical protein
MNEEVHGKSRTIEMLADTLYFERNITDSRLADFQGCFRQSVEQVSKLAGYQSREELIEKMGEFAAEDINNSVTKLFEEIKGRVDNKMSVMSELFFKGDEIDNISRVFLQSTFQRVRRIISTSRGDNVKLITEILYRLIILSVLCQYRNSAFQEAFS